VKIIQIYGPHVVHAALVHQPMHVLKIYLTPEALDPQWPTVLSLYDITLEYVTPSLLTKLAGTAHHQGVVADFRSISGTEKDFYSFVAALPPQSLIMAVDKIVDPQNLGAIFRNSAAFKVNAIVASTHQCVSLTPSVYKVSQGAATYIPFFQVANLARALKNLPPLWWRIGTSSHSPTLLTTLDLTPSIVWVLGSEGQGLKPLIANLCDHLVAIDSAHSVESLNVGVASGIILYETWRQRQANRNKKP
jgi:23S rRNA (guanosine2251-2'-O)-methyltransferase